MMKAFPHTGHGWRRCAVIALGVPLVAALAVKSMLYTYFIHTDAFDLVKALQPVLNTWMLSAGLSLFLLSILLYRGDRSLSRCGLVMVAVCILMVAVAPVVTTDQSLEEVVPLSASERRPPAVPAELLVPGPSARPHILSLQQLQLQLDEVEESAGQIPASMAQQVEALLDAGLDADERMQAWLLLVAIHDQRGEETQAFDAFIGCLTASEQSYGVEHAVSLAQSRASDIVMKEKNYSLGADYYKLIRERYPTSNAAGYATIKIAEHYNRVGRKDLAMRELREFTTSCTNSPWFYKGVLKLSEDLFNCGRREEACGTLQQVLSREGRSDGIDARLIYMIATYRTHMGSEHRTAALEGFQRILDEFPDSNYVIRARRKLERLAEE